MPTTLYGYVGSLAAIKQGTARCMLPEADDEHVLVWAA
jgi:hypothetical protein